VTGTLVVDFDSTIVGAESLEELAAVALEERPDRREVLAEVQAITRSGMEGEIPMSESLSRRLALFRGHRRHLEPVVHLLAKRMSPSFRRNRDFFVRNLRTVIVVTSGFFECAAPVVEELGIPPSNVYANRFLYDSDGSITGLDTSSPLAGDGGKAAQVAALGLERPVCVLGDGYTDYEIRKAGLADTFVAYTETVRREAVVAVADHVVSDFDGFLELGIP
jgi:D-3-phosphoglycerate dehydrogenase